MLLNRGRGRCLGLWGHHGHWGCLSSGGGSWGSSRCQRRGRCCRCWRSWAQATVIHRCSLFKLSWQCRTWSIGLLRGSAGFPGWRGCRQSRFTKESYSGKGVYLKSIHPVSRLSAPDILSGDNRFNSNLPGSDSNCVPYRPALSCSNHC